MIGYLPGIAPVAPALPLFPVLSQSNSFSRGGFSQAAAQSLSPFGYNASLAQALRSPFGAAGRSGALRITPQGIDLAAAFAAAPRYGLPSSGGLARRLDSTGLAEAITRSNPLSQEALAAKAGRDYLALGYVNKTPFGTKTRAIALTPLGILVSGTASGIFGNENTRVIL